MNILVTGLSGLIGGALRPRLEGHHVLRALNRRPVAGVPTHQADIADLAAIEDAFRGVDAVVHLAAEVSGSAPLDALLGPNIVGTYNVLEASRRAGVRRVVLASSGATVTALEREEPVASPVSGRYEGLAGWPMATHETIRPGSLYGVSKVWGEALARYYSDVHGLSAICLRIGNVTAADRPRTPRDFAVWCSQRDVVRMIELAIAAPDTLRFDVFFVNSRNRWGYRDLEHARAVLGFEPLDAAEDHR